MKRRFFQPFLVTGVLLVASSYARAARTADLSVLKTAPASVTVGQNITYTILVTNVGPNNATNTVLTDTLPSGVTFVSASSGCSGTSTITCQLGTLAANGQATITIVVQPSVPGSYQNTASVTSTTADPDHSNNQSSVITTVTGGADLAIQKTGPATAAAGSLMTYTLLVTNAGPLTATGTVVTDALPSGVTFVNATVLPSGSCIGTNTVTCSIGSLAANSHATVTIVVTPNVAGNITNTASVSAGTPDPVLTNNQASVTTAITNTNEADLSILESGPAALAQDMSAVYSLLVSNNGPNTAVNTRITDTLPAGLTYISATTTAGTCSFAGGTLTCVLGNLPVNANATVTITATATQLGNMTNTAQVTSDTPDPVSGNNQASVTSQVTLGADISVQISGPVTAVAGSTISYTAALTNSGPNTATNIHLTGTLPAGLMLMQAGTSQGTCATTSVSFDCSVGSVAAGVSANMTLQVRSNQTGLITTTVQATSDTPDPNPTNNSDSATTNWTPNADLALQMSGPVAAIGGALVSYTLTVSNQGPSNADNTQVVDALPAELTYVSATTSQGSCSASGATVTCPLGTLAVGSQATVTVTGRAAQIGPVVNSAQATSTVPDLNPNNNSASLSSTITDGADLSVSGYAQPTTVLLNTNVTYYFTLSNGGPSISTSTVFTDPLGSGLIFQSVTSDAGNCLNNFGLVTCTFGDMPSGIQVHITVVAKATLGGSITNTAQATGGTPDPDLSNNQAPVTVNVTPGADLSIQKSAPGFVLIGSSITYTITVTNHGPLDATNVIINDLLPAGSQFSSVTMPPTGGYYTMSGSSMTFYLGGALAANTSATVTLVEYPLYMGTVTNVATVSGDQYDPDPTNNISAVSSTVGLGGGGSTGLADLAITQSGSPTGTLGHSLFYYLTVTNAGPDVATHTVVTDTLPSGVTFQVATPSRGTCAQNQGTVSCATNLLPGDTYSVSLYVTPTATGTLTNIASVGSDTPDPNPSNNYSSFLTLVSGGADLELLPLAGPTDVLVGSTATYTMTLINHGPNTAQAPYIYAPTLSGMTVLSVSAGCTSSLWYWYTTIECVSADLPAGSSTTFTFQATFPNPGQPTNYFQAYSVTADPVSTNNVQTATLNIHYPMPALTAMSPVQAVAGDGGLTLTVTGSDFIPGAQIVWNGNGRSTVFVSSQTLTTVLSATDFASTGTVTVAVANPVPSAASNTLTFNIVSPGADLAIRTRGPAAVTAGTPITYTLQVTNNGPSPATGTIVTDALPSGLSLVSASASQGSCTSSGNNVTCQLGNIDVSQVANVTVVANTGQLGTIVNTSSVTAATVDPTTSNNQDSLTTIVANGADLSLQEAGPATDALGTPITYTLLIANSGPSSSTDTIVTDTMPFNSAYVSATASQGTCVQTDQIVQCSLGTLAAATNATISIVVMPLSTGTVTNAAQVASATADPAPANNHDSLTTTVTASADLSIQKTGPAQVGLGNNITYTILVANNGPNTATNTVVSDPLPAGLSFVSATSSIGSCSNSATGTVTCLLGSLANGTHATISVTAAVTQVGSITNTAQVSSDILDPVSANNQGSATTVVSISADLSLRMSGPATAILGTPFSYTLLVTNNGPLLATQAVVTDSLPAGLNLLGVATSSGTCSGVSTVTCHLGDLAPGGSAVITLNVRPAALGGVQNIAQATSGTPDPDLSNNSDSAATQVNNPLPTLFSLSPSSATAGGPGFTLAATGSDFVNGAVLEWNGQTLATTFVSSTQVTAVIASGALVNPGTVTVVVLNPAPGGGLSNSLTFTIAMPLAPTVNDQPVTVDFNTAKAIVLTGADPNGYSLTFGTITAPGHGTLSGGGANLTYTPAHNYAGLDSFTFLANNGYLNSAPGAVSITVSSPTAGPVADPQQISVAFNTAKGILLTGSDPNGLSLTFSTVTAPAHGSLTGSGANITYMPDTNYFGPDSFTFTVNNGFQNSPSATVSIVVNQAPTPTLTAITPGSALAGSPAFTLALTGTNFLPGSVVTWNGSSRTTTFVSATQLTAAIPAGDMDYSQENSTASVQVLNPDTQRTQALPFSILFNATGDSIMVEPDGKTIAMTDTQQFAAHYFHRGQELSGVVFQWNVSNPDGSISALGTFRPSPSTVSQRLFTVTASANGVSGSAKVTVLAPGASLTGDLCGAYAYPVPWKLSLGAPGITFTNLATGARIRIFTPSGQPVQTLKSPDGGLVVWDLRNSAGDRVASGVYLYIVDSAGGSCSTKSGKLVIIQ